jgi:DNA repair protein RecN (Recombination protein N)
VLREGKSRAWVNGSPVTISVLSEIGGLLVDLHGQHETQSLLRPDAQRDMLDAYADADVERVAVRDAHARLKQLEQREAELTERQADIRKKADYLRHVLQEIERAKPKVGEDDALEIESKRLSHAEELGRLATELESVLEAAGLTKAHKILAGLPGSIRRSRSGRSCWMPRPRMPRSSRRPRGSTRARSRPIPSG